MKGDGLRALVVALAIVGVVVLGALFGFPAALVVLA